MASSTREQYLERASIACVTKEAFLDDMLLKVRALGTFLICRPSHRVARNLAHVGLYSREDYIGAWRWPAGSSGVLNYSAGSRLLSRPACDTLHSSTSQEAMASYEDYLRVALIAAKQAGEACSHA